MEYSSFSALDQLDKISQDSSLVFEQVRSDTAGVVSYGHGLAWLRNADGKKIVGRGKPLD